jgi:hypothetical protein
MTNEEAIKLLDDITSYCDFTDEYGDMIYSDPYYEALDMAIKALEQGSVLDKIRAEIKTMSGDIETIADVLKIIKKYEEPSIKLTNSEWIDFLSEQFNISRTSAKEMLHTMMSVKKEDNFKKQFSGRK